MLTTIRQSMASSLRVASFTLRLAGLVDHAKMELTKAGLFDKDSDYNGAIGKAVMDLCACFAEQGHSGFSAEMTRDLFNRVSQFKNLTPITNDPSEWDDVSEMSGYPFWQNKRNSCLFSKDGGKTWYDIDRS